MESPLVVAAGLIKHPNGLKKYLDTNAPLGALVCGSLTLEPREGNRGDLLFPGHLGEIFQNGFGLNSYGMLNIGLHEAIKLFPENPGKPCIISIAGVSTPAKSGIVQILEMLEMLRGNPHIARVEINLGCPNTGHLPMSYCLDDIHHLLKEVGRLRFDKPVWMKLSPYATPCELGWLGAIPSTRLQSDTHSFRLVRR